MNTEDEKQVNPDETEQLIRLVYISRATQNFEPGYLYELLAKARENNTRLGVTGVLLFVERSFLQVLEGESSAVLPLFEKISADPRHSGLSKLIEEEIETRDFGEWSMGHSEATLADLTTVSGLNDILTTGEYFKQIDAGRVRNILAAFREGRWRQGIK